MGAAASVYAIKTKNAERQSVGFLTKDITLIDTPELIAWLEQRLIRYTDYDKLTARWLVGKLFPASDEKDPIRGQDVDTRLPLVVERLFKECVIDEDHILRLLVALDPHTESPDSRFCFDALDTLFSCLSIIAIPRVPTPTPVSTQPDAFVLPTPLIEPDPLSLAFGTLTI